MSQLSPRVEQAHMLCTRRTTNLGAVLVSEGPLCERNSSDMERAFKDHSSLQGEHNKGGMCAADVRALVISEIDFADSLLVRTPGTLIAAAAKLSRTIQLGWFAEYRGMGGI